MEISIIVIEGFERWLVVMGYAESTVYGSVNYVRDFYLWLKLSSVTEVSQIDGKVIRAYYNHLQKRTNKRKPGSLSDNYINSNINARVLQLQPSQILELHGYLTRTRPKILREIGKSRPARKPDKINQERLQEQLIISINGSEHIKSSLHFLFKAVQKSHPELLHPKQIRASVITHWLKNQNLRQVQYMSGHKHVSSTERY